jgi:hypothetical protein
MSEPSIDLPAFIRDRASLGWSRQMVRETLGMSQYSFGKLLAQLSDITWPGTNRSLGHRLYYQSIAGVTSVTKARTAEMGRKARYDNLSVHELCGIKAPVSALCRLWAEWVEVSPSTVQRRLNGGASVYDAFFCRATAREHRRKASPLRGWPMSASKT